MKWQVWKLYHFDVSGRVFEYDPAKSAANAVKHGIDFEQAQALWDDAKGFVVPSNQRSSEDRMLVVGMIDGRLWTAIVTMRDDVIRIISVRRSWDKEVAEYGRCS